jgi:hypothetical protein
MELSDSVLARALAPSPILGRTLDTLHLATVELIRATGEAIELASYDNRRIAAALAPDIPVAAL